MLWNSPFWDDNTRRANRLSLIILLPATLLMAFADSFAQEVGMAVLSIAFVTGVVGTLAVYACQGLRVWDGATAAKVFPWPCMLMCNGVLCLVVAGAIAAVLGSHS